MPRMHVDGLDMFYELSGSGTPVVFISGITLDHLPWKLFQVPAFTAAGYQCLVFDNRDVGQTGDSPAESYDIGQFARDTVGLAGRLKLERFHLVGYSLGGAIAQEIALGFPERVRSLTLVSTLPKADAYLVALFDTLKAAKRKLTREEFLQTLGLRAFSHRFYANPEAVTTWLGRALANPFPQSAGGFERQANAGATHDTLERLKDVRIPTHVIVGDEDILVPPRHSRALAERIPGAKLTVIPEVAHAVTTEKAAEFNQAVMGFLAQH